MLPIVSAQKAQQTAMNGARVQVPAKPKRGRDLCDAAIRLRVYLAKELRRQADEAGLDPDHYCSSSVTSLCCALEKQGLRGIPEDSDCDVVA